jgi:hypothetical protein
MTNAPRHKPCHKFEYDGIDEVSMSEVFVIVVFRCTDRGRAAHSFFSRFRVSFIYKFIRGQVKGDHHDPHCTQVLVRQKRKERRGKKKVHVLSSNYKKIEK